MCAWVLFANLQANLSPFRCIPHYVTQRDVECNNCSLEQVQYRHFPRSFIREGVATPRLPPAGSGEEPQPPTHIMRKPLHKTA